MKYIVESNDVIGYTPKYAMLFGDGYMIQPLEDLEVLTADYINEHYGDLQDEAYQRGYKDCETRYCSFDACPNRQAEYQRGLDDAWKAAKKIFGYEIDGGIPIDKVGRVFGYSEDATFCTADIIRHNTASEAIAKLKAYEEKQKADNKIEVGDEVNWLGDCFIVARIFQPRNGKEQCDGIDDDGCVYHDVLMDDLEKTGRHFDIQKILEEMKHD